MLELSPRFSPSQKLTAVNFGEVDVRVNTPRNGNDDPYVSISLPSITTTRKDGRTVLYAGGTGLWKSKSKLDFDLDNFTLEDLLPHLDKGSAAASLNDKMEFDSLGAAPISHVVEHAALLQEAFQRPDFLPMGYEGWFKEVKRSRY